MLYMPRRPKYFADASKLFRRRVQRFRRRVQRFHRRRGNAADATSYPDDSAFLAHTTEELKTTIDILSEAKDQSIGLSINSRYSKIIDQPAPGNLEGPPDCKISGTTLEFVEHFLHLGSLLSQKVTLKQKFNTIFVVPEHSSGN